VQKGQYSFTLTMSFQTFSTALVTAWLWKHQAGTNSTNPNATVPTYCSRQRYPLSKSAPLFLF